jgi:hypothetical protein
MANWYFARNSLGFPVLLRILLLSRQRSRVRVSSSPPFFPNDLVEFRSNRRGHEKGALRALFVPFFCVAIGNCRANPAE